MIKPAAAECFGTFLLVFLGAGACAFGHGALLGAALVHGFAVIAAIYIVGGISGAHINPAVTLGLLSRGKIAPKLAGAYVVAQFAGALAAAGLVRWLVGAPDMFMGATTNLADGVTPAQGVVVEAVLTAFLVASVMASGVYGQGGNVAGLAIGITLMACILMGGPLTGASLNPARTFGPALVNGAFDNAWVYLAGPFGGGVLGAWAGAWFHEPRPGSLDDRVE